MPESVQRGVRSARLSAPDDGRHLLLPTTRQHEHQHCRLLYDQLRCPQEPVEIRVLEHHAVLLWSRTQSVQLQSRSHLCWCATVGSGPGDRIIDLRLSIRLRKLGWDSLYRSHESCRCTSFFIRSILASSNRSKQCAEKVQLHSGITILRLPFLHEALSLSLPSLRSYILDFRILLRHRRTSSPPSFLFRKSCGDEDSFVLKVRN